MIVNFNKLPDNSRLWIYQSNRDFSDQELDEIRNLTESFLSNWQTHNQELEVSYEIKYNRFLILAVNESFNSPGGCSIDLSLRFINDLSKKINIDLLDRMSVNYKDKEDIKSLKLNFIPENFFKVENEEMLEITFLKLLSNLLSIIILIFVNN